MLPAPKTPKAALESDLLSANKRLQECLVKDSSHVRLNDSGEHVLLLQKALNKIGELPSELPENGTFDATMAGAVARYKKNRGILNYAGQIDDIVGKLTITAIDNELVARNRRGRLLELPVEPPLTGLKQQDIVIQIAGTGNLAMQGLPDPGGAAEFTARNTPSYLKTHDPLVPLCFFGGREGSDNSLTVASAAAAIRQKSPLGRTIIIGISVGGLIAAKIASILTGRSIHLDYVAINDAALIAHGSLQEVASFNPVTAVSTGAIKADRMDNFFQSFSHDVLKMKDGPNGFMPGTEFHGRFTNGPFVNQSLDDRGKVLAVKAQFAIAHAASSGLLPLAARKKFADLAHVAAVQVAFGIIDPVVDRLLGE